MSAKHTDGPWTHGRLDMVSYPQWLLDDPPPTKLIYSGESVVAMVDASLEDWRDIARLIAAAPELLAALVDVRAEIATTMDDLGYHDTTIDGELIEMIDAAIAKATGEA